MAEFDILIEFKMQLIQFFDELIDQVPEEGDLIVIRIMLKDQIPIIDVMNHFLQEILPLKHMVIERDENFFLKNNILFEKLDKNKVNHFKKIWRSNALDTENKKVIWEWFLVFIRLAERYQRVKLSCK